MYYIQFPEGKWGARRYRYSIRKKRRNRLWKKKRIRLRRFLMVQIKVLTHHIKQSLRKFND